MRAKPGTGHPPEADHHGAAQGRLRLCLANGIDIRRFGSQGQQRTAALSLKLSEIELVKAGDEGYAPILLLDDVLSELDSSRQNYLLNSIGDIQTIVTCTGLDEFVNNRFEINRVFPCVAGRGQRLQRSRLCQAVNFGLWITRVYAILRLIFYEHFSCFEIPQKEK